LINEEIQQEFGLQILQIGEGFSHKSTFLGDAKIDGYEDPILRMVFAKQRSLTD